VPDAGLLAPILLTVAIFLAASTVQAAIGFGSALIAMPLLALVVDIQTATGVVGLVVLAGSTMILIRNWRSVSLREGWQLVVSAVLGIPIGLALLTRVPEGIVKGVLGVVLIGFGLYRLISPTMPEMRGPGWVWLWLSGFTSGILGGAYNTNGPPVVIYGALRRWPPDEFRATCQMIFLATGVFIAAGQGLAGLWTPTVLRLALCAVPAVIGGAFLGGWLGDRIPRELFNRLVNVLLIVMGAMMFV
jgi:uncharacterized membrane protein YfcA